MNMLDKRGQLRTDSEIAGILRSIAHPARLQLLNALRDGEECVCHLTALLGRRQAYVSQQLMLLREAGLVQERKESYRVYYRLKEPRVLPLLEAINALRGPRANLQDWHPVADCACPHCQGQDN